MLKLPEIILSPVFHNKEHQIKIVFTYNDGLIDIIKKIPERRWSKTLHSWYVKNTPQNLSSIITLFKGEAIVNTDAIIETRMPLHKFPKKRIRTLTLANKNVLNEFYLYLKGKRYSNSTVETYTQLVADFIEFYNTKALSTLNNRDVELFIETIYVKRNYAISTQRQFVSALKLFIICFTSTLIEDLKLMRPKASKKLPNVLSQNEVIHLLRVTNNIKHKTILALIYSSGLRISELIHLKIEDLRIERRQIHIKDAKGRKDRMVVLAESVLPLLQNYLEAYKPSVFLIQGQTNEMYSANSVRKFMKKACKKAGLTNTVTPHTLRHSYATHLIESGVGLRHIQELLGHASPKTTMIYTHIARKDILSIASPLDNALSAIKKSHKEDKKVTISLHN